MDVFCEVAYQVAFRQAELFGVERRQFFSMGDAFASRGEEIDAALDVLATMQLSDQDREDMWR